VEGCDAFPLFLLGGQDDLPPREFIFGQRPPVSFAPFAAGVHRPVHELLVLGRVEVAVADEPDVDPAGRGLRVRRGDVPDLQQLWGDDRLAGELLVLVVGGDQLLDDRGLLGRSEAVGHGWGREFGAQVGADEEPGVEQFLVERVAFDVSRFGVGGDGQGEHKGEHRGQDSAMGLPP
jgi:hypothetical protein